jgi:hypothetical protein
VSDSQRLTATLYIQGENPDLYSEILFQEVQSGPGCEIDSRVTSAGRSNSRRNYHYSESTVLIVTITTSVIFSLLILEISRIIRKLIDAGSERISIEANDVHFDIPARMISDATDIEALLTNIANRDEKSKKEIREKLQSIDIEAILDKTEKAREEIKIKFDSIEEEDCK